MLQADQRDEMKLETCQRSTDFLEFSHPKLCAARFRGGVQST